jgi:hypothetical protein
VLVTAPPRVFHARVQDAAHHRAASAPRSRGCPLHRAVFAAGPPRDGRAPRFVAGPESCRDKPCHCQGYSDLPWHGEKMAKHPCAAEYSIAMRILGLDVGRRRVGVAISDGSATLARPLKTLPVTDADIVDAVTSEVRRLAAEDDGVGAVVVGLPGVLTAHPANRPCGPGVHRGVAVAPGCSGRVRRRTVEQS